MKKNERAKQFLPFSPLKGFDALTEAEEQCDCTDSDTLQELQALIKKQQKPIK